MTGNLPQLERLQQWSPVAFRPDAVADGRRRGNAGLSDRIRLHESVLTDIQGRPAISKRLAIAVQQLAALGRTTIVKGCSDPATRRTGDGAGPRSAVRAECTITFGGHHRAARRRKNSTAWQEARSSCEPYATMTITGS